MVKKITISLIIIILILAVIMITVFSPKTTTAFNSSYKTVSIYAKYLFALPTGTNALEINYTNFKVNSNSSNTIASVNVPQSGYLYFSNNENSSVLMDSVYILRNSTISSIALNISNETITINNTKYVVNILNKTIYSKTINTGNNNGNQSVILQISGSITPLFNQNKINFYSYQSSASYDNYSSYEENFPKKLNMVYLSKYNFSKNGNYTNLTLKITNNASMPIQIKSIALYGKLNLVSNTQNLNINISDIKKLSNLINYTYLNSSISMISSKVQSSGISSDLSSFLNYLKPITSAVSSKIPGNVLSGISGYLNQNITLYLESKLHNINYSQLTSRINLNISDNFSQIRNITSTISYLKDEYLSSLDQKEAELNYTTFIPSNNHTLLLVNSNESELNSTPITILPDKNITLRYYGEITFSSNNIFIPMTNNIYKIWLIGDNGLIYNYNISAS